MKKTGDPGPSLAEALSSNSGICGLEHWNWRGQGEGSNSASERSSAILKAEMTLKGEIPLVHCNNGTIRAREEVQKCCSFSQKVMGASSLVPRYQGQKMCPGARDLAMRTADIKAEISPGSSVLPQL